MDGMYFTRIFFTPLSLSQLPPGIVTSNDFSFIKNQEQSLLL